MRGAALVTSPGKCQIISKKDDLRFRKVAALKKGWRRMLLVQFDKPDGAAAAVAAARESLAVARVIASVGQRDFGVSALRDLNDVLSLCWMSIYSLRTHQPPLFHGGGSLQMPDRTTEAFHFYRQGIYLTDHTFDEAKAQLKGGDTAITHLHAQEVPEKHRSGIYTRNGLQERTSLVRMKDDGSLLAINLYRNRQQGTFHDADIDLLRRLGQPLLSCVNLHIQLSGTAPGADEPLKLAGPLDALPRREKEVCERLLRGWTHEGVAADLRISTGTVKTYRDRAFERLGIHHRNELFALALAWSSHPQPAVTSADPAAP
ncbi:MAG: hypothetical protein JWR60_2349 [Polaromonas sp.]|nr:hypothetical protein [Polaromonas sp.]